MRSIRFRLYHSTENPNTANELWKNIWWEAAVIATTTAAAATVIATTAAKTTAKAAATGRNSDQHQHKCKFFVIIWCVHTPKRKRTIQFPANVEVWRSVCSTKCLRVYVTHSTHTTVEHRELTAKWPGQDIIHTLIPHASLTHARTHTLRMSMWKCTIKMKIISVHTALCDAVYAQPELMNTFISNVEYKLIE